jgi:hypothetical protein
MGPLVIVLGNSEEKQKNQ